MDELRIIEKMAEDERLLRTGWALAYSGSNLYTDDGELQDNSALPHIDWMRDPPITIRNKIETRAIRKLEEQNNAEQGNH